MTAATNEVGPILAPVDFSDNSPPSALCALRAARDSGARLVILHVAHDPPEAPGSYLRALGRNKDESHPHLVPLVEAAREVMDRFLHYLEENHPELVAEVAPESQILEGLPGSRILEFAEQIDASSIVMGSHGRTGLSNMVLGSKAAEVLQGASVPVTVVKDRIEWR